MDAVSGCFLKAGLYDERKPVGFHVCGTTTAPKSSRPVSTSSTSPGRWVTKDPSITMRIYAHEAEKAHHGGTAAAALERIFGA